MEIAVHWLLVVLCYLRFVEEKIVPMDWWACEFLSPMVASSFVYVKQRVMGEYSVFGVGADTFGKDCVLFFAQDGVICV